MKMSKFPMAKRLLCVATLLASMVPAANATLVNVAVESDGGVATQSSTLDSPGSDGQLQVASRAIDGDTNGNWYTGEITHTNWEWQPWWEVALGGGSALIHEIDVWNRTDCCADRLDHFDVLILEAGQIVWSSVNNPYVIAWPEASFLLTPGVIGDTVRIQLEGGNYLSLAEVQVWAEPAVVPEPETLALVALGAIAIRFYGRGQSNNRPPADR